MGWGSYSGKGDTLAPLVCLNVLIQLDAEGVIMAEGIVLTEADGGNVQVQYIGGINSTRS